MRMRRIRRRVTEGATDWGVGAGIIRLVAGTHYPTLSTRAIICHFFFLQENLLKVFGEEKLSQAYFIVCLSIMYFFYEDADACC